MSDTIRTAYTDGLHILGHRDWDYDRGKWLNASSALSCARRQWFENRHGGGPTNGYAVRGNQVETFVIDALRTAGVDVIGGGSEQVSLFDERRKISGTPDGFIEDEGDIVEIEIKSIDPRARVDKLPRYDHIVQLHICMELAQATNFKPAYGWIVYVDASDWEKTHWFKVERNMGILDQLAPRASQILRARKASSLEAEGKLSDECRYCPFFDECGEGVRGGGASEATKRALPKGSKLDEAVVEIVKVRAEIKTMQARDKELKETIIKEMLSRKKKAATVGTHAVTLSERAGSTTVDWRKAEKDGIYLGPYKKIGKPSQVLTVE